MSGLLIPQDSEALRANNFDALRLFLALLVIWSHNFAMWYGTEAGEPISLLLGGVYNAGNVAVLGFFTISGFLITLSYARSSSPLRYLGRRVRRIYPGYLVAVAICALLIVPAFSSRHFLDLSGQEWLGFASNLLLRGSIPASDAFMHGAVNGSLWSIPYEFWCYLGVLALGLVGLIHARPLWLLLALGLMAGRLALDLDGWRPGGSWLANIIGWPYLWFVVGPSFLLGAAVYQYRKILPRSGWLLLGLVAATIASARWLPAPHVARLLLPPTLAYLVFYLAFSPRLKAHGVARHGDFSYGAYLYAFPIQQMLVVLLKDRVGFALYAAVAFASTLIAAVLSWYLVERWFMRGPERNVGARALGHETIAVAP